MVIFTPIKVNYPMSDKSTLRDAGCIFFGLAEKNFGLVAIKVANKVVKKSIAQKCRYKCRCKCRFKKWTSAHNQKNRGESYCV